MMGFNIMEKLRFLWKSVVNVVKIFVTYGEVLPSDGSVGSTGVEVRQSVHKTPTTYNGLITSVQFFFALLTATFCILIAPFTSKVDKNDLCTRIVLLCLMALGLFVMVYFYRSEGDLLKRNAKSLDLKGRLTLAGLVVFYVFSCVLDLFTAIQLIKCTSPFRQCGGQLFAKHVVTIIFHWSRVIYLGGETMLCLLFSRAKFRDSCSARYGLVILQTANLGLWFDILLQESWEKMGPVHGAPLLKNDSNCIAIAMNMSDEDLNCLHRNTTDRNDIRANVSAFLNPFPYEFSILFGEFLIKWFMQCSDVMEVSPSKQHPPKRDRKPSVRSLDTSTGGISNRISNGITETNFEASSIQPLESSDESTPLLSPVLSERNLVNCSLRTTVSSRTNSTPHQEEKPKKYSIVSLVCFIASVLTNIAFAYFSFTAETSVKFYFRYSMTYWASIALINILGYHCSTFFRFQHKRKTIESLDFLFLFTAIGPFIYCFTDFIIIFNEIHQESDFEARYHLGAVEYSLLELSFFLSIFIQIPFSFQVQHVIVSGSEPRDQSSHAQPSRDQSSLDQLSRDQSSLDQLSRDQSSGDQPSRGQPSRDQISRHSLSRDQLSNDQSSRDFWSRDQMSNDRVSSRQESRDFWSSGDWSRDQQSRAKTTILKAIVLHLAICNGTMWIVDTFSPINNIYLEAIYFQGKGWSQFHNFVLPLSMFFRFNSCIMFTCAYLRFTKFFQKLT